VALEKARVTCLPPHLPAATSCHVRRPKTGGDTTLTLEQTPPTPPGEPSASTVSQPDIRPVFVPCGSFSFLQINPSENGGLLASIQITGLFSYLFQLIFISIDSSLNALSKVF
jgi:hypothetical protein